MSGLNLNTLVIDDFIKDRVITEKRICGKCKEPKSLSREFFTLNKRNREGFHTCCKKCDNKRKKGCRERNIEHYQDYGRVYRFLNADKVKEKNKRLREKYKEYNAAYQKRYREANKAVVSKKAKIYHKQNKVTRNKNNLIDYYKNRDKLLPVRREQRRIDRGLMSDQYILTLINLRSSVTFKLEEIPKEFINNYRQVLELKRIVKNGKEK